MQKNNLQIQIACPGTKTVQSTPDTNENEHTYMCRQTTTTLKRTNVGEGDAQHSDSLVLRVLGQVIRASTQHRLDLRRVCQKIRKAQGKVMNLRVGAEVAEI